MNRTVPIVAWVIAAFAGGITALTVTWIGDAVGALLEGASGLVFRSWEFGAIQVSLVNTPTGILAGLAGVLCKRWWRGLGIGVLLHAAVFTVFLLTSDSFRAAPATVNGWVFAVGILGGGIAAAIGGLISQVASGASSSRLEI